MSDLDETVKTLNTIQGARRALGDITMSGLGLTEADLERLRALNSKLTRRSMDLVEVLEDGFEQQARGERFLRSSRIPVHRVPNNTKLPTFVAGALPIEGKCGPESAKPEEHFVFYRFNGLSAPPTYWCARCNHQLDVPEDLARIHQEDAAREDGATRKFSRRLDPLMP